MAVLGKRKAASRAEPSSNESSNETLSAEEIFRRHFESQFAPIDANDDSPASKRQALAEDDEEGDSDDDELDDEEDDEGEEDEWGGLSGDDESSASEEDTAVEIIDHSTNQPKTTSMSKSDLKSFMSSRPPSQTSTPKPTPEDPKPKKSLPEDAPSLIKQDLELRRLLSESHLLHPQALTTHTPAPFASGRTKLKATDMRIQALGSKASILKQDKMAMNMRKGIDAHREAKETKRRREAKENGIILERPELGPKRGKGKGKKGGNRDVRVDGPGVGRMRGAELRISEGDVRKIEGSRDAFGRRGGGRGGRGGRGGSRGGSRGGMSKVIPF